MELMGGDASFASSLMLRSLLVDAGVIGLFVSPLKV
ncbi:hypothetical protein MFUL124B02_40060 [Myxococcus fulvus 124B02]|nr:hypothetical protein MFUL124B02_40060 [Myxococcus fulvus 124B02]